MQFLKCKACGGNVARDADRCPHCGDDRKKRLKTLGVDEIREAYRKQKEEKGWTFYDEHDLIQRTFENRFHFLLLAYSLFLTAYFQSKEINDKLAILFIGLLIVLLLSLAIRRTTNRFLILLDIVHSLDHDDVSPIIHEENLKRHKEAKYFRKNSIAGKWIPRIMITSIVIGIIYNINIETDFLSPLFKAVQCLFSNG